MGVMTKATNSKFLYNRINKLNAEIDELKKEVEILQKEKKELTEQYTLLKMEDCIKYNSAILFSINGVRGHAFMSEPTTMVFDKKWYKLIPLDSSMFDKFDNRYDSISVTNYNRKTSTLDRFTVAYDETGLKAAMYNDKFYIAQLEECHD